MTRFFGIGLMSVLLLAQAPAQDIRNAHTPNTDTHVVMPEYGTLGQWEARKAHLRTQILSAAGLLPMPDKTPLHPQVFGRLAREDYSIEKVLLETMPGFYLGGNLYRPLGRSGKLPAVLTPHGHWTYGRLENQAEFSGQALGISLARQGYVAFGYDMIGYNDTLQTPHRFGGPREQLWSFGPLGLQLWNSIRVVDFLQSLGDVDRGKIAVTGASGGGTQTFLLAAVDERVGFAAPVNMVSAIMQGGCRCENQPNLRVGTHNLETAALFAPRPMLLVAATGDWTRNVPKEEYPAIRKIYALYGKAGNVETIQFQADHNYNQASREAVYRFFGAHILGDTGKDKFAEGGIAVEQLQDMLALQNRKLPDNALTFDGIFELWKSASRRQTDAIQDRDLLRTLLRYSIGVEWPEQVTTERDGQKIVLSRAGENDRVPGLYFPGAGPAVLAVDPDGAEAAQKSEAVRKLITAKRAVLLIDAFQTGLAVAPRDRSHEFFLTFNRGDDANRVQDILTALAFLGSKYPGKTELIGSGKASVWSLFAAALSPAGLKLTADLAGFSGGDEDLIGKFFVPGLQRAGGLKTAMTLTEGKR